MHVTHQKYVVKWVQHDYYLLCDNKRCIVGKQQLNYWKAKNCHVFLSQISPRIKKDSQRIIRSTFDVFKKGRWASTVRAHQELLQNSILRSSAVVLHHHRAPRHTQHSTGQQGGKKVSGNGNRRGVRYTSYRGRNNWRESASSHSCPCPVAPERQAARATTGHESWLAGWLAGCSAGLERSCIGLATGGMNECLQAVCDAIECLCRPGHGMAMTLDEDLTSIQLDCSWELCCFAYDNN